MTSAFVDRIKMREVRFDQVLAFSDVLNDIPQYLGSDAALDAAVKTYTSIVPFVMTGTRSQPMLKTYIDGLKTLRTSLSSSAEIPKATTWAAVYLMWISQVSD